MNEQFDTAYKIFVDFYGEPKWMVNPKEGQNTKAIIDQWCNELKGYTVDQIRQACAWITRKRRVMTFPSLDLLLCELSDKEKDSSEDDIVKQANRSYQELLAKFPALSRETTQETIYKVFGVCVDGYDPTKTE